MRFARADSIIYFHLPRRLCIFRVLKRLFTFDRAIADTGCLNGINMTLIKYIWNFDRDKRENIEGLRKRYPNVEFLIFRYRHDPQKYLEKLIT